jgi:hypothetical protein
VLAVKGYYRCTRSTSAPWLPIVPLSEYRLSEYRLVCIHTQNPTLAPFALCAIVSLAHTLSRPLVVRESASANVCGWVGGPVDGLVGRWECPVGSACVRACVLAYVRARACGEGCHEHCEMNTGIASRTSAGSPTPSPRTRALSSSPRQIQRELHPRQPHRSS